MHEVDADTSQSKINNFEALKITKKHPKEEETQGEAKTHKVPELVKVSLTSSHAIDLPC